MGQYGALLLRSPRRHAGGRGVHLLRRSKTCPPHLGWYTRNLWSTIGAFLLAAGVVVFLTNWCVTVRNTATASP
jgi:heme/copper-type cytochrome/quinol oxidase subunit 1